MFMPRTVIPVWTPPNAAQLAALAGVGLLMALAQTCTINAVARAEASFVAPFAHATLIIGAGFDAAIFARVPDMTTLAGASIIIAGAALLALREMRAGRPA
ncbi:EamA family transporter [Aquicoccus sp. G2-2]|uniref:EamA family transporter n=1 Tax=Aquicoccus sp. G2-2 TaxID=3092120 RepID=UPI002ADF6932|nr:EamA family transporter [Aquicoccus sp. G2-2]MEA1114056.1 EamA family transporter [Aquicoccus sp. G2-2]